jgi:hypothetical protein
MQDYLYISWNLHGKGGVKAAQAILQRCDLRHVASQELDVPMDDPDTDEPWLTGSMGSVRLPREDPRIPRFLEELRRIGEEPFLRNDREYTKKEIASAPWLSFCGGTTSVEAGRRKDQAWDFASVCPTCGSGAVPVPPLIVRFERIPKQGWSAACPFGLIVVSRSLAQTLVDAGLTGFSVEAVRTPSRQEPDDRFRWLRITSIWPRASPKSTWRFDEPCPQCDRPSHFDLWKEPTEIYYESVPADACDFNHSWEQYGYWKRGEQNTGAAPQIILSQRAYRTIKAAGIKSLSGTPLSIREA